jgi:outer membrane protein OmpA-like peptidoglycan-associated protein/tetratricopeptide (TPR) repeat protein
MVKNIQIGLVWILLWSGVTMAQEIAPEKRNIINKYSSQAEKRFAANDFSSAIVLFKKIDSIAPGIPEVDCNIGICYLNSRHKAKSLPYFETAYKNGYRKTDIYYYLGRAYHYNMQFDKSVASFEEYKKQAKLDSTGTHFPMDEVARRIEVCGFAKQYVEDSLFVTIENAGPVVNTVYDEYVPILSTDERVMFFTSRRPTEFNDEVYKDGRHFEDIHIAYADTNEKWISSQVAEHPLNESHHDAAIGISADAKTLYLFRALKENPALGSIYYSGLVNGLWNKPQKLGSNINTHSGWESSISITSDNKRIYFSSDRPGGYGGFDIWYCDLVNNTQWSEPQNLGPEINTKYDEDCPFIHFDNITLFFSSNGHTTMGGYDVFSSVFFENHKKWTKPKNLGYPINTVEDDMYFVYSSDGSKGYMSSAIRPDSKGGHDIYVIHRPFHAHRALTLRGKVLDSESLKPINATITVMDLTTKKVIGVFKADSLTGRYFLPLEKDKVYSLQIESGDRLISSEQIDMHNPEVIFSDSRIFSVKEIKKGVAVKLNNIFFDVNTYDLQQASYNELDKLALFLQKQTHVVIKINGYTDSVGEDLYNLRLSKKRAHEVSNYLRSKGVAGSQLKIEGFGETKPFAPNSTEEGRKLNRVTEFEIYDLDTLATRKKDYLSSMDSSTSDDVYLEGIVSVKKQGEVLIPYVLYSYNDADTLNDISKKQLGHIVAVMKRIPKLKLSVTGSVDNVRKEYNNKALHEKRIKTVIDYLEAQGIGSERVTPVPFAPSTAPKSAAKKSNDENRKVKFALLEF